MATLLETLIETITKDLANIKLFEDNKQIRKETSLLLSRIESARKIAVSDENLLTTLSSLEKEAKLLKENS